MDFWDFFWLLIWSFFFVAYLMVLFQIFGDLFRDDMSGWFKALWVVFLFIAPFLGSLIYLIARGRGMAERRAGEIRELQERTDAHIGDVAGGGSPASEIAAAKQLLDSGAITQQEFDQLKTRTLS